MNYVLAYFGTHMRKSALLTSASNWSCQDNEESHVSWTLAHKHPVNWSAVLKWNADQLRSIELLRQSFVPITRQMQAMCSLSDFADSVA